MMVFFLFPPPESLPKMMCQMVECRNFKVLGRERERWCRDESWENNTITQAMNLSLNVENKYVLHENDTQNDMFYT